MVVSLQSEIFGKEVQLFLGFKKNIFLFVSLKISFIFAPANGNSKKKVQRNFGMISGKLKGFQDYQIVRFYCFYRFRFYKDCLTTRLRGLISSLKILKLTA